MILRVYSHLYKYLNISSDESNSQQKPIKDILKILEETDVLVQKDEHTFQNKETFPWIDISCVYAKNGSYSSNDKNLKYCNLIVVVFSRDRDNSISLTLLKNIADKIGWKLTDEAEDE